MGFRSLETSCVKVEQLRTWEPRVWGEVKVLF